MILNISIILFIIMELSNVLIMYFKPDTPIGNGIGVFDAFNRSKEDKEMHMFIKYLKNWVANVKLIFIVLLVVILIKGSEELKVYSLIALIISILLYYITLHPIITKLDKMGHITPKGYSKVLFGMITGFVLMFTIALILHFAI